MKRSARSTSPEPAAKKARGSEWTRVERRKGKKEGKRAAAASEQPPSFAYSASELRRRKEAVSIWEVRDLALHCVADAAPGGWVRVENRGNVAGAVVLLVPGLTHDVLGLAPPPTDPTACPHVPVAVPLGCGGVPFISRTFSHALPTRAPGDRTRMHSVLAELLAAPVTGEEKRRRTLARGGSGGGGAEQYVLSAQEMVENGYPMPRAMGDVHQPEDEDEWVESELVAEGSDADVFALDCEMCVSARGRELARVCVVRVTAAAADVVLDSHVLPGAPITDYLTRFSGITARSLENCTTTLRDVQGQLLALLAPRAGARSPILLGHSLESDLSALKLRHARCIDTALLYDHPRGRPLKPALAWLTRKWCGRDIQARGDGGHDPEEDARACADLFRCKLANGPAFGSCKSENEPIFDRIARAKNGAVRTAAVDRNPAQGFAARASTPTPAPNDAAVCAGVLDALSAGHGFVFARFTELADARGWVTPKPSEPPTLEEALHNLDARLTDIHAALPPRTALILLSGHSDPRPMSHLSARRLAFEAYQRNTAHSTLPPIWTAADARALEEAVAHARRGLLFLGFKNRSPQT